MYRVKIESLLTNFVTFIALPCIASCQALNCATGYCDSCSTWDNWTVRVVVVVVLGGTCVVDSVKATHGEKHWSMSKCEHQ
jgi:hypothetical protein